MPCVKFEQPHHQRARKPQERRGKSRAHATQLILKPIHQPPENGHTFLALSRLKRADRIDNRWHRSRQTKERAHKTKENQHIGNIARDIAAFFHPRSDGIKDRARRRSGDLHRPPPYPRNPGHRRKQPRWPLGRILRGIARDRFDPCNRREKLKHLHIAGKNAHHEDDTNRAVEHG